MALSIPWWYHNRSWRLRVSFHVGCSSHHIRVEIHMPPCSIYISTQIWWDEQHEWKPTVRNCETWNFILATYKKNLLQLVPTWMKSWWPLDLWWGHDWEYEVSLHLLFAKACTTKGIKAILWGQGNYSQPCPFNYSPRSCNANVNEVYIFYANIVKDL